MSEHAAPTPVRSLAGPILAGAALVLPFAAMQLINRRVFDEGFPFVLFAFMSAHALAIAFLMTPALRQRRAGKPLSGLHLSHWARLALGAILVYAYVGVIADQMPCFLGVPNCD